MSLRILVVEDNPDTRRGIVELLLEEFPQAWIEDAGTIKDGRNLILKSRESEPYDVAILDFKLPLSEEDPLEVVDQSLCALMSTVNRKALVIHVTKYVQDKEILNHVQSHHQSGGPEIGFISKLKSDYPEQLEKQIRCYLVERAFAQYTGAERNGTAASSPTQARATFFPLVAANWPYLDPSRKALLRTRLEIEEADGRVQNIRPLEVSP